MKVYQKLASTFNAYLYCQATNKQEWADRHLETIKEIIREYLPHGSGFDSDITLDINRSKLNKLILCGSFHAMNDNGCYCCWIDFECVIEPSLISEIDIEIKGRFGHHQDLREYIGDMFYYALMQELELMKVAG